MKKYISVLITFLLLIMMTACDIKDGTPVAENTTTNINQDVTTTQLYAYTETDFNDTTTSYVSQITTELTTVVKKPDISLLSVAEIIDMYKNAAAKSDKNITSVQNITLDNIIINDGTGMANSVIGMVKPIISKVVSSNSTEFEGITGGYTKLTTEDVQEATAVTNGDNTVIKLKMKEQTDKGQMSDNSGSVGHAIFVIGDLSTVMGQLSDSGFPVEIENENVSATYINPNVIVTIDKDGNIINGTWSYTVTIVLENFKVAGSTVDKTAVTIENVITYNGGTVE